MLKKPTDHQKLRAEMSKLIEALELPELNKQFLQARWLEQVIWMEGKALDSLCWHRVLRLATIIGGVIVPALVSLNLGAGAADMIKTLTFAVSLMVALSAAVEEFFHYGERWRHYRRTVESLKSEGWQFFQLSGPYANLTHVQAYPAFAARVEELSREEVETYMTQVVKEKKEKDDKAGLPSAT
jgi:phosphoserine phosphatase